MLRGRPRAIQARGMGDLIDLLLGLRSGAVLSPGSLLLALPARTGLADVGTDVDGVTLRTAEARLRSSVYVQRGGRFAASLDVGG